MFKIFFFSLLTLLSSASIANNLFERGELIYADNKSELYLPKQSYYVEILDTGGHYYYSLRGDNWVTNEKLTPIKKLNAYKKIGISVEDDRMLIGEVGELKGIEFRGGKDPKVLGIVLSNGKYTMTSLVNKHGGISDTIRLSTAESYFESEERLKIYEAREKGIYARLPLNKITYNELKSSLNEKGYIFNTPTWNDNKDVKQMSYYDKEMEYLFEIFQYKRTTAIFIKDVAEHVTIEFSALKASDDVRKKKAVELWTLLNYKYRTHYQEHNPNDRNLISLIHIDGKCRIDTKIDNHFTEIKIEYDCRKNYEFNDLAYYLTENYIKSSAEKIKKRHELFNIF